MIAGDTRGRRQWPKVQARSRDRESKPSKTNSTGPTPAVLRIVKARAAGRCERCRWSVSSSGSADVHHRIPRGMGGARDPRINQPSNLVVLCRLCHSWIERYRVLATAQGWLLPHTPQSDPTKVPVETFYGTVLFSDDDTPAGGGTA